jgi:hypothetical protein
MRHQGLRPQCITKYRQHDYDHERDGIKNLISKPLRASDLQYSSSQLHSMQNEMNNVTLLNTTLSGLNAAKLVFATTANVTAINSNSTSVCTLSPHARALSSVLTSLVGAILTGLSSGGGVAIAVGCECYVASIRIALVGVYQVYSVSRLELPEGGDHFQSFLNRFFHHDFGYSAVEVFRGPGDTQVNFLGWVGWSYTTLYSPTIQVMWLLENWNKASTSLKFARAIGVNVAGLPSTFDTRARYGKALGRLCGRPAAWIFGVLTAASTVTLAAVSIIELGLAAKGLGISAWMIAIAIYVFFLLLLTWGTFSAVSPQDDAQYYDRWTGRLGDLGVGAVTGLCIAVPAFYVMMAAQDHPGLGLSAYMQCEGIAWWQKIVAVLP